MVTRILRCKYWRVESIAERVIHRWHPASLQRKRKLSEAGKRTTPKQQYTEITKPGKRLCSHKPE